MSFFNWFSGYSSMLELRVLDGDSHGAEVNLIEPVRVQREQSVAEIYRYLEDHGYLRGKELQCGGAVIRKSSNETLAGLVDPGANTIFLYVVTPRQVKFDKFQVLKSLEGKPIHILEDAVQEGGKVLEQLLTTMRNEGKGEQDAGNIIKQIIETRDKANIKKTIIGVVGTTGAGKSSLINALLDEEQLVPTSSMKACTAVVTEISYNHQAVKYRAEFEFVSHDSWRHELNLILEEDANGVANDPESGGIVPWHKLKAVYPYLTKGSIQNYTVEQLMASQAVAAVLGTTKDISHDNAKDFYNELKAVVEGKEEAPTSTTASKTDDHKAYWPLIKVIRIFVKHDILESGLVIVDLPGVQDSNAAREKVAQDYMQSCSGLFMVSPITRAVSDKAAKELLGERFRRQMKMDLGYVNNVVTFIATRTDDISITEASRELGVEKDTADIEASIQEHENQAKELEAKVDVARRAKQCLHRQIKELDGTPQRSETRKRSSQATGLPPSKRARRPGSSAVSTSSEAAADSGIGAQESRDTKRDRLRNELTDLDAELNEWEEDLAEWEEEIEGLRNELATRCIHDRNNFSKSQIKADFASGIREIDEQLAYEEDPQNFDPQSSGRDYKAVGDNLAVFCVSSRAYQKLCGRLQKDDDVRGFPDVQSTNIPQLQEHCKRLILKDRKGTCERFLTSLSGLLNNCLLSVRDRKTAGAQHARLRSQLVEQTQARLIDVDTILERRIDVLCQALDQTLGAQLRRDMVQGAEAARDAANATAALWGEENFWNTYKAICKRNGSFNSPQHAWNERLAEPLIRNVAHAWEQCFGTTIQEHLRQYGQACASTLRQFHEAFLTDAQAAKIWEDQAVLGEILNGFHARLSYDAEAMIGDIQTRQRDINRDFVPAIRGRMIEAYGQCAVESGKGMFDRMKATIEGHVRQEKRRMFHASIDGVLQQLDQLVGSVRRAAADNKTELMGQFRRPYLRPVHSGPTPNYALQNKLADIIEQAGQAFADIKVKHEQEVAEDAETKSKVKVKLEKLNGQDSAVADNESAISVDDDDGYEMIDLSDE